MNSTYIELVKKLNPGFLKINPTINDTLNFICTDMHISSAYPNRTHEVIGYLESGRVRNQWERRQKVASTDTTNQQANAYATSLAEKYDVLVEVLSSNKEYYSDETIKKAAQDKVYFVSAESPAETAKITDYVIKHQILAHHYLTDLAAKKRIEQSSIQNAELAVKIEEVRTELKKSNPQKEPPLSTVARILNERGINSPRGDGSKWYSQSVKRILDRVKKDPLTDHGRS